MHEVLQVWPAGSDTSIRERFDDLWRVYAAVNGAWAPRRFAEVVEPILASLADTPEAQAAVVDRLAAACLERARLSPDAFRPAEVSAALMVCLLPYLAAVPIARQADALATQVGAALLDAGHRLVGALDADRYALVSRDGMGMADLFLLPVRLTNILGWIGAATVLFPPGSERHDKAVWVFETLIDRFIEHYSTAILAISEVQAAPLAIAFSQAMALGLADQGATLAGLLFSDLTTRKAHLASDDIPLEQVLAFLRARASGNYGPVHKLIARPEELTPVLLLTGAQLGLDEVFDNDLWEIDRHVFNTYLTDDWAAFGATRMDAGQNLMWTVGDTIFRVKDLDLAAVPEPPDGLTGVAAMLAALTYPDRVPWFMLVGPQAATSTS